MKWRKFFGCLGMGVLLCALILSNCDLQKVWPSSLPEIPDASSSPSIQNQENKSKNLPSSVALVLAGVLGDHSVMDSAREGMGQVAEKYGLNVDVLEMGSDTAGYEEQLRTTSASGYPIIVVGGSSAISALKKVSAEYPDTRYILFDGKIDEVPENYPNVYSVYYRQNESAFLAGVLAAGMTETGQIGYLAGEQTDSVRDSLIGYIEGAIYRNPDIRVEIAYADSSFNETECYTQGAELYSGVTDIAFINAGMAGSGGIKAAAEAEKLAIGADQDQALFFESTDIFVAGYIPTSVRKDVGESLVRAFDRLEENTFTWGITETLGLAEGYVGICENENYQALVPQTVREAVEEAKQKIISGEIIVQSTETLGSSGQEELFLSVQP